MRRPILTSGFWFTLLFSLPSFPAPYIPEDGNRVIERLPNRSDPAQRVLQDLRTRLTATPDDLGLATELAQRYIEAGRKQSDPRYFGYAQAALSPWWRQPHPPIEVKLLRAILLQNQHRFQDALKELDGVIQEDHNHAQAWLTRATIMQVQGDYVQAARNCGKLFGMASELITVACMTSAASLNGKNAQSYALLVNTLQKNADAEPSIQIWAITLLGEMAVRRGDIAAAERHFRQALSMDPADSYLLGAYTDLLLDQNRFSEVRALLKNAIRVDSLLLRYAIALKRQGVQEAKEHIALLQSRFNAAAARGDDAHEREKARFELHLQENPKAALMIAAHNWTIQKEPADARILLESALANKDRSAAYPVLNWLKDQHIEDAMLESLASRIERTP